MVQGFGLRWNSGCRDWGVFGEYGSVLGVRVWGFGGKRVNITAKTLFGGFYASIFGFRIPGFGIPKLWGQGTFSLENWVEGVVWMPTPIKMASAMYVRVMAGKHP